jgi:hypothetical protein
MPASGVPKSRVGRDDDSIFKHGPGKNQLIFGRLHAVVANVRCIMARLRQQQREPRRKRIIDQKSHADCGRGSSRSIAEAAAYRKHSRMSPSRRSGYSAKIFSSDQPPARSRRTVATGMRRPRMQGTPPICGGSTVISSKCFMASVFIVAGAGKVHNGSVSPGRRISLGRRWHRCCSTAPQSRCQTSRSQKDFVRG